MQPPGPHPQKCNWPVWLYLGALLFALVSLVILTQTLTGAAVNAARASTQLAIGGVLALRLIWAISFREQSKAWIPYVVGMFLAVPIWILVLEPFVLFLRR